MRDIISHHTRDLAYPSLPIAREPRFIRGAIKSLTQLGRGTFITTTVYQVTKPSWSKVKMLDDIQFHSYTSCVQRK